MELGADFAYYSLTKYMNGHTDVIMGSVSTNNEELAQRLRFIQVRKKLDVFSGNVELGVKSKPSSNLVLSNERSHH